MISSPIRCNISTLDLNDNQIGAPVITQAIKYNRSLTNLDIRNCPIDDDGLGSIGKLLLDADCSCHVRYASRAVVGVPPQACAHHDALASPQVRYVSCAAFEVKNGNADLVIHGTTLGSGATRLLAGVFTPRSVQITTPHPEA